MDPDTADSDPVEISPLARENGEDLEPLDRAAMVEELGRDRLLQLYRRMKLIRHFEQQAYQQYLQREIGGFCHLYTGQEAVAVGAFEALDPDSDYTITPYRDHGYALAIGLSPKEVMAELYGKKTGSSDGKGGSMHLFDPALNFMGGHAIVGGHIPLAAGLGFAINYRNESNVALCFLGDGAMNQGAVHEGMNLTGLYELPVIYVCENNGYGMGTQVERAAAEPRLYRRADAQGIPGFRVDGLDVLSVYNVVSQLFSRARETSKPAFLEVMTYRYRGHSMSDPAEYRSDSELEEYRERDPIDQLQNHLLELEVAGEEELEEIDEQVKASVQESVDFAEQSSPPDTDELYEDVYVSHPRDTETGK